MKLLSTAVVLAACLCLALSAPAKDLDVPTPFAEGDTSYRLSEDISPVQYNISIRPYLLESDGDKRFKFDGEVYIEILTNKATTTIELHTKNLTISEKQYWIKGATAQTNLPNGVLNDATDIIKYTLTTSLAANTAVILHFKYTGLMLEDMHGFYRSSYNDSSNNVKWIGSTQFQTNHARRVFPSFDEPKFKATFNVNITRHKSYKTASNTEATSFVINGDYVTDVYRTTPKMSTYLLAFLVSDFAERTDGQFGVLARPDYYSQTEYSFNVGRKILKELDTYLDFPYYGMGNAKMQMVAVPDFSAGAMENWGLLTYRERSLLVQNGSTPLSSQQAIAAVIAHEQAHMWFGDLVTCNWWSWTWLNEGFARYFQYFGTAMVETELELEKQFIVDQIQAVMQMDSTNSTNPMSDLNTNTPSDLSRMFNSISYNKGASFIRMVKHVMGEEKFKKSLQEYLKKYQFLTTVPDNLFDMWKANFNTNFLTYADGLFSNFTTQVGYPLVYVDVANDGSSFELSQKRFLLKDNDGADKDLQYTVPISYTTSNEKNFTDTDPKFFIVPKENKTQSLGKASSWIILNVQQTGYYRVNYSANAWKNLNTALKKTNFDGIHEMNRAQIVDDLFNLARAGIQSYELTLDIMDYLASETHYLPWTAAFNGFNYLSIRLGVDTQDFSIYLRNLMEKAYNKLGFSDGSSDSALDVYTRTKILSWSCRYGNDDCTSKANEYFKNWLFNGRSVPANIRSVVYCSAMREGEGSYYTFLYKMYRTATVATEETLILNALGCVKSDNLRKTHFNNILTDEVRLQDKSSALSSLYTENNENVEPMFDLVTANYEEVQKAMGGYSACATVIANIASRFTTEAQKKKLEDFNKEHGKNFGAAVSTLNNAEKTVAENLEWSAGKLAVFKEHLKKRVGDGAAQQNVYTVFTLVLIAVVAILFH